MKKQIRKCKHFEQDDRPCKGRPLLCNHLCPLYVDGVREEKRKNRNKGKKPKRMFK